MSEPLQQLKKPPYFMLAILFFGAFVSFLNNSLMNVALPTIMVDFGMSDYSTVQWLTTGYMLVSGVLIPVSAFLLTRFTNRALFITAMTLFTIGTGIAAIAPNFGVLLTGRMIQAAGSSVMSPLLMNVMLISFPREKRGAAMGVFGLVMITAPALGPTLSGYIVEYYDWRVLFEMILPFSIIALVLAIFKLQNVMPTKKATLDYLSVVLSTLGFGGLLYGFSSVSSSSEGWKDPVVITTIAAGAVLIILFVIRQLRSKQPLLNLSVYKFPMFALGNVISVVNSAALFSGMILTPAYMQTVKGISPLDSGLMMLPGALVMGVMSPITGKLFDKFGPRILGIIGIGITAIATYQMTFFELDTSNLHIILVYSVRMLGISMVMMPIMTNGLNQLPTRLNPHGTAVNNTIQQVAGAIGTAIFVSIMNSHTTKSIAGQLDGIDPTTLPADQMSLITKTGMLEGIQYTFLIATFTTLVAFVLTFFVKRVDVSKEAIAKIEGENATS
ncbi:DHA2 family efflux MFS transporter permease subunit [Paenibacillus endoradicis]|uniref:DHA2 family efflux MFS transporter permease subunit n=1 Tax=Paenibacillus endoradicis TaxID=2972487 RepID=UPI0021596BA0|nr:DHA2 family efflux MFS transporter permease subunit [Paenibacillus endoradicis]MCR8659675.1 DHA2 family efflux MFS transporter permease subunit [Paenibacillus endoradicis]